jgi:hypothetical protein
MLDKQRLLMRAFERAQKQTQPNGDCLEWTGLGSLERRRPTRPARKANRSRSYMETPLETLRCNVMGREIHPRTLFYAIEHGLTIAETPELRCGCHNRLCVLPAHAKVIGPPAVTAAPAMTPETVHRLTGMVMTQAAITAALNAHRDPYELALPQLREMEPIDPGVTAADLNMWCNGKYQFEQVHLDRYQAEKRK